MKNKGGRPHSDNPKQASLSVRMASSDYERIKEYATDRKKTISQVVMEALNLLYAKEETKR